MRLNRTKCCALLFLSDVNNGTNIHTLFKALKKWQNKEECTTVQCVVLNHEKILAENLKRIGFTEVSSFKRREVYRFKGHEDCNLYQLDLENLKENL